MADAPIRQGFDPDGFLGSQMRQIIDQIHAAHCPTFSLVAALNSFLNRALPELASDPQNPQHVIVASLFNRLLTTYQGVVVLGERGLRSESKVLCRTLLEVTFRLVAIASDPALAAAYIREDELPFRLNLRPSRFQLVRANAPSRTCRA